MGGKLGKWLQDLGIPKGTIFESIPFPGTESLPAAWAHEFRLNQYSTRENLRPKDCYNSSSLSKIQERFKLCCCSNWTAPCPRSTVSLPSRGIVQIVGTCQHEWRLSGLLDAISEKTFQVYWKEARNLNVLCWLLCLMIIQVLWAMVISYSASHPTTYLDPISGIGNSL